MTIVQAAEIFNIPCHALSAKLPLIRPRRTNNILTEAEDNALAQLMLTRSKEGNPLTRTEALMEVKNILEKNPREKVLKRMPGFHWLKHFLRRHPDIMLL